MSAKFQPLSPTAYDCRLRINWTTILYNKFAEYYSLWFTYNHSRWPDSRKINTPYWRGRAVCRTGLCISVDFTICTAGANAWRRRNGQRYCHWSLHSPEEYRWWAVS